MRALFLVMATAAMTTAAPTPVTIQGHPVAPTPNTPATGLCATALVSTSPATDFPASASTFVAGMNAFLEANTAARVTSVTTNPIDLSNNDAAQMMQSYGDFRSFVSGCATGGCDFAYNDTTTAFGTRLRGYLAVTAVGVPLHFGAYADDAVAIVLYDATRAAYPIVVRPPALGSPTWRSTNTVTFAFPGLYPIEILHAQLGEHAALEVSTMSGAFTDFELPYNQAGSTDLQAAGFALLGAGMPLFLTEDGAQATTCAQCDRQRVGMLCGTGSLCGAGAVCEACITAAACGDTCGACSGATPICAPSAASYACTAGRDGAAPPPDAPGGVPGNGGCCGASGDPTGWLAAALVGLVLRRRR
jgi:outer membrane exchange protein TraA